MCGLAGVLWIGIILSCAITGFMIWGIQLAYSQLTGTKSQSLHDSLFVAWGTLLEDIPPKHKQPQNTSAQVTPLYSENAPIKKTNVFFLLLLCAQFWSDFNFLYTKM